MRVKSAGVGAMAVLLAGGLATAGAADKPQPRNRRTLLLSGERGRLGVTVEDVTSEDVARL